MKQEVQSSMKPNTHRNYFEVIPMRDADLHHLDQKNASEIFLAIIITLQQVMDNYSNFRTPFSILIT